MASYQYTRSVEETATTAQDSAAFDVRKIVRIINDGTVDIIFSFNNDLTSVGKFTLKQDEELTDIDINIDTLYYKTASGSAAFRALGLA